MQKYNVIGSEYINNFLKNHSENQKVKRVQQKKLCMNRLPEKLKNICRERIEQYQDDDSFAHYLLECEILSDMMTSGNIRYYQKADFYDYWHSRWFKWDDVKKKGVIQEECQPIIRRVLELVREDCLTEDEKIISDIITKLFIEQHSKWRWVFDGVNTQQRYLSKQELAQLEDPVLATNIERVQILRTKWATSPSNEDIEVIIKDVKIEREKFEEAYKEAFKKNRHILYERWQEAAKGNSPFDLP